MKDVEPTSTDLPTIIHVEIHGMLHNFNGFLKFLLKIVVLLSKNLSTMRVLDKSGGAKMIKPNIILLL
jgi:hypothetical protein